MDKITSDLLIYSKAFCERAEREYQQATSVGFMMAVMNMQDAVEFCQVAIMHENHIPVEQQDNHKTRFKKINTVLAPKSLPLESQMDFLNVTRGKVKHHASVPSDKDTEKCMVYGRDFLEQVFQLYFAVSVMSMSKAILIEDAIIRNLMEEAQRMLDAKDLFEAMVNVKKAFVLAQPSELHFVKSETFHSIPFLGQPRLNNSFVRVGGDRNGSDIRILGESIDEIAAALKSTHRRIEFLEKLVASTMMGIDRLRYLQFEQTTPILLWTTPNEWEILWSDEIELTEATARENFNFAMEMVLLWQEKGVLGKEENPFDFSSTVFDDAEFVRTDPIPS